MNIDAVTSLFPWLLPLGSFILAIFLLLLIVVVISALQNRQYLRQREALKGYIFPASYLAEVKARYPHLTETQVAIAFEQLRLYFSIYWKKEPKTVAMPSKLVDVCWHIFIMDTRRYQQFCEDVYGHFLHHMPKVEVTVTQQEDTVDGDLTKIESKEVKEQRLALKTHELDAARIYQWASLKQEPTEDGHKTSSDTGLDMPVPLLFSIDQDMLIADGYFYSAEVIRILATYDINAAEAEAASLDSSSAGSLAGCGDGGVSCGGCGGSV